jgi:hypothetical protein
MNEPKMDPNREILISIVGCLVLVLWGIYGLSTNQIKTRFGTFKGKTALLLNIGSIVSGLALGAYALYRAVELGIFK